MKSAIGSIQKTLDPIDLWSWLEGKVSPFVFLGSRRLRSLSYLEAPLVGSESFAFRGSRRLRSVRAMESKEVS